MTEAELQTAVIDTARVLGYLVAHFRPAETKQGWRTPVQADGKGFPDLVLTGRRRVIFAELKNEKRPLEPEQRVWLEALAVAGAEVYLWRPADWSSGEIERTLRVVAAPELTEAAIAAGVLRGTIPRQEAG